MTTRVILVTDQDNLDLTASDRFYAAALRELGADVAILAWDDAAWASGPKADIVVLRSTWDTWTTPERWSAFGDFLARLETLDAVICNPPPVLRWGLDKERFAELGSVGLRLPASIAIENPADAHAAMERAGWSQAVLKPTVGGSGFGVSLLRAGEALPTDLPASVGRWLLQEFVPEISTGELNVVVIDGQVSHMVRKTPAVGEWRSNWRFKPDWRLEPVSEPAAEAARRALSFFPEPPLYLRVDGVVTETGFVLLECEVESPSLFFFFEPDAAMRMARATLARCG